MTMNPASATEQAILADLISLWQQRRAEGQTVTPSELCRDRPELLPQLEQRIAALKRMADLADAMQEGDTIDPTVTPHVASDAADAQQETLPTLDFLEPPVAPLTAH
jgi:hypothetical protein